MHGGAPAVLAASRCGRRHAVRSALATASSPGADHSVATLPLRLAGQQRRRWAGKVSPRNDRGTPDPSGQRGRLQNLAGKAGDSCGRLSVAGARRVPAAFRASLLRRPWPCTRHL